MSIDGLTHADYPFITKSTALEFDESQSFNCMIVPISNLLAGLSFRFDSHFQSQFIQDFPGFFSDFLIMMSTSEYLKING